jgi:hypothetical protein
MAEKNKERLKEITDSIEQGIQNLFQSDRYTQYLRTMSRFHRYSVNNTMLIYMQKPNATLVSGFNKWRDKELPELRASLETINKTASGLISDIDQNFREVLKEYDSVLEQFAADAYRYTASVMEPPFPLNSIEEEVPATVEDLKSGYEKDTRAAIFNAAKVEGAASPDELLRWLDEIEKIYPPRETEAIYLLDNAAYLYLKENEDGYGYTLYDKESLRETADGFADEGVSSIPTAYEQAFALEHLTPATSEKVPLDILNEIAAVREQDVQEYIRKNNLGEHQQIEPEVQPTPDPPKAADMLPDAPEQALDEYPMPDSDLTVADLEACGYLDGDELRDIRFEPLSWLESKGISVDHGNYDIAYTAPLTDKGNTEEKLAVLWDRFNNDHPADYHRPSLSVSDIVALKQNGVVSCHYVDSFGFQEIPDFLKPENYLKSAEMSMEDDYDMIDGIIDSGKNPTVAELEQQAENGQPISLLELAEASRRGA